MNLAREPGFRLGNLEIRPATRELIHPGGRESLEPRVMSVLIALVQAKGEVVTRDDLSAQCWDGRIVSDDAINRVLSRIRKLSELTGGRDFTLETITKVGYRLMAVQAAGAAAEGATPAPPQLATPASEKPDRRWVFAAIATLAVLVLGGGWWLATREPQWSDDPTKSLTLAVLPFDNLGDAQGDDVLALGMSREIRNTLSRVRGLRVVSDSSSFAIASEPLTSTEMGRRLQADLLLDGSFERTGDTVRLSAELVDGWDGVNVWTGTQSGPAADLNRLRQEMAARVFEQMVVKIGPNRLERLADPRVEDGRSYRLLVEANQLLETTSALRMRGNQKGSLEAGARASALVEQALAIDPEFAMALEQKARIIALEATPELFEQKLDAFERRTQGADYLRRALATDPDYAPALSALGEYYRRYEWRWATAGAMLERAVALDPNLADARVSYSYFLSGVGRCVEALQQVEAAREIDPEFGWRTMGLPRALKCLGRRAESEAAYLDVLRQDPDNLMVLREIYLSYLVRGDAVGSKRSVRTCATMYGKVRRRKTASAGSTGRAICRPRHARRQGSVCKGSGGAGAQCRPRGPGRRRPAAAGHTARQGRADVGSRRRVRLHRAHGKGHRDAAGRRAGRHALHPRDHARRPVRVHARDARRPPLPGHLAQRSPPRGAGEPPPPSRRRRPDGRPERPRC